MKLIIVMIVALVAFAGALVVAGKATGVLDALTRENVGKLISGKPEEEKPLSQEPRDDVVPLTRALKMREEELNKREESIRQQDAQIKKRQTDLEELQTQIKGIQEQIQQTVSVQDAVRNNRFQDVAMSLSKMKPANAAKILNDWPAEEIGGVLALIKEKDRGKILDAMTPEKAASALQAATASTATQAKK